jgi:hypothetical protein
MLASPYDVEITGSMFVAPVKADQRWDIEHRHEFPCQTRASYLSGRNVKNVLLSRIKDSHAVRERTVSAYGGSDWNERVIVEIGRSPGLSDTQKKVTGMDSHMRSGSARIPIRKALLFYALRRLGLDTNPAARRAQDQQIVLLNRDEVHFEDVSRAQ